MRRVPKVCRILFTAPTEQQKHSVTLVAVTMPYQAVAVVESLAKDLFDEQSCPPGMWAWEPMPVGMPFHPRYTRFVQLPGDTKLTQLCWYDIREYAPSDCVN
jgi:hypothetical protein